MNSDTALKLPSKRVIIRAHEHWHDDYQQIIQDWFRHCGYATNSEPYQWTGKHYVHLGGINNRRFHLIIDMERDGYQHDPAEEIPCELYRLRKPNKSASEFIFIDPLKQKEWYSFAREFTKEFAWGGR